MLGKCSTTVPHPCPILTVLKNTGCIFCGMVPSAGVCDTFSWSDAKCFHLFYSRHALVLRMWLISPVPGSAVLIQVPVFFL